MDGNGDFTHHFSMVKIWGTILQLKQSLKRWLFRVYQGWDKENYHFQKNPQPRRSLPRPRPTTGHLALFFRQIKEHQDLIKGKQLRNFVRISSIRRWPPSLHDNPVIFWGFLGGFHTHRIHGTIVYWPTWKPHKNQLYKCRQIYNRPMDPMGYKAPHLVGKFTSWMATREPSIPEYHKGSWWGCDLKKPFSKEPPFWRIHPWKLTCPPKRNYFSREYIFQPLIFRGHVSFQGSNVYKNILSSNCLEYIQYYKVGPY